MKMLPLLALIVGIVALPQSLNAKDWGKASGVTNADLSSVNKLAAAGDLSAAPSKKRLGQIKVHTEAEIVELLNRVEQFHQGQVELGPESAQEPIQVLLHGNEIMFFQSKNYDQYDLIVDRAAKLHAFKAIEFRACKTWMSANGVSHSELPAFVGTVRNGHREEKKLIKSGYEYF